MIDTSENIKETIKELNEYFKTIESQIDKEDEEKMDLSYLDD